MKKFKILFQSGEARIGEIRVNGKKLETPYLYPVLAFFCGGTWKAKFGGGIYRKIKENFLMNENFQNYFKGIMTSIAHLVDFPITKEKLEIYTSKTIHEWFNFNGILFVDSGGFKILTKGSISGKDFEISTSEQVLMYQKSFGADILASLDYPISPNLKESEVKRRVEKSIDNAVYLLENKPKSTLAYIAVHGYSKESLKKYIEKLLDGLEREKVSLKKIDGIAIGSLVPIKSNVLKVLEIVKGCKEVLEEFNMSSLPLHIFGISGTLMPLLAMIGVDTFDSTTYINLAINGIYLTNGLNKINVSKVKKRICNCEVCKNSKYFELIKKSSKIDGMVASLIAIHNFIMFSKELQMLQKTIKNFDEDYTIKFIQERYSSSPIVRKGLTYLIKKL